MDIFKLELNLCEYSNNVNSLFRFINKKCKTIGFFFTSGSPFERLNFWEGISKFVFYRCNEVPKVQSIETKNNFSNVSYRTVESYSEGMAKLFIVCLNPC